MHSGLLKIKPDRRDYSLIHSFGATMGDVQSLPDSFSIYDGRPIPNQNDVDTRFTPQLPPLPFGCTGETGAFESGLQDKDTYSTYQFPYYHAQETEDNPSEQNSGRRGQHPQ